MKSFEVYLFTFLAAISLVMCLAAIFGWKLIIPNDHGFSKQPPPQKPYEPQRTGRIFYPTEVESYPLADDGMSSSDESQGVPRVVDQKDRKSSTMKKLSTESVLGAKISSFLVREGNEAVQKLWRMSQVGTNTGQWTEDKKAKGLWRQEKSKTSPYPIWQYIQDIEMSPDQLFRILHTQYAQYPSWNDQLDDARVMKCVNDHTDVVYKRTKKQMMVTIEFFDVRQWEHMKTMEGDDAYVIAFKGLDEHQLFEGLKKENTLGLNGVMGFVVSRRADGTSRMVWIVQSDPRPPGGFIGRNAVPPAVRKAMIQSMDKLHVMARAQRA